MGTRGRQGGLRSDPLPDIKIQIMDTDSLRAIQRQNDLNAFLRYERRLARAYAQSQNPYPPRWLRSSHGRRIQGHRLIDASR